MSISLSDLSFTGSILIAFLALLHSSFQLGTSVLTLLNGHSISRKVATRRLAALNMAYIVGVIGATGSIIAVVTAVLYTWLPYDLVQPLWLLLIGWASIVGWLVMALYFRKGRGTRLWLPRDFAEYLTNRASHTKNTVEAFALGLITAIAELPFTLVIILMVSLTLVSTLYVDSYALIIALYSIAVCLPLIAVGALAAGGHRLSTIQRWRESSKVFLQYAAGVGLIAAAVYALAYFVIIKEAP